MTLGELLNLGKEYGWKENFCDLNKGNTVLRANNGCLTVLRRHPDCRRTLIRRRCEHELAFKFLRCGHQPYIIGPFGGEGFNLKTNRFQRWKTL